MDADIWMSRIWEGEARVVIRYAPQSLSMEEDTANTFDRINGQGDRGESHRNGEARGISPLLLFDIFELLRLRLCIYI